PVEEGEILLEALGVADPKRREGADELEAVRPEVRGHRRGVCSEVAGGAELDPGVAEAAHRLEHPVGRDQVVAVDGPLPDAPGARRAREPHRNLRSARRASSSAARTASTSDPPETSDTGTSHQLS